MHRIATLVYNRWLNLPTTSGSGIVKYLHDYEYYSPLDPEYPTWDCKGNGVLSKTCHATYDTPYEALKDHRVLCGGDKDPNPNVAGCGRSWYTCKEGDGDAHQVKYCDNNISYWPGGLSLPKHLGKCGEPYRDCPNSASWSGDHDYEPVYSYNNGEKYKSGYQAKRGGALNTSLSAHRGNMSSSSSSFRGPTKYSESISDKIDESPNCSSCIDGSEHCPNASQHGDETASNLDPPAMHLCNAHEEWQSGIHTAAACGLAGHFVCDNLDHSSSYTCNIPPCSNRVVPGCLALCPESSSHGSTTITAAPTPTPTPAPTPESTPILVSCGGNGWTGCTEQVSSENDHYVSSCSNCSNSYWTCRPVHGAVKHEPPRTCARNGCDNTFTLCSRPPCDVNSEWKCQ